MPTVPRNNVSEPAGPRLPGLNIAEPHTAQAMSAVINAAGERVNITDRIGRTKMQIAGAKAYEQGAMFKGLENLGELAMQGSVDLDHIAERRARDEASTALTEYTAHMNRTTEGYTDESTGKRVAGTLETPYRPANSTDEADGPTLSTARASKDWLNKEDSAYAKLSPRAKKKFDEEVVRVYSDHLRRAGSVEFAQIKAFRQANDKAALEADRDLVKAGATDVSATGNANWIASMKGAKDAQIMREIGEYRTDDPSRPLAEAEWANEEVAEYAKFLDKNLQHTFLVDKINTLKAAASVEPDPARREMLLKSAESWAGFKHSDGTELLDEDARAQNKLQTDAIRIDAVQRQEREINAAIQQGTDLVVDSILTGKQVDTEAYNSIMSRIPPDRMPDLQALVTKNVAATEMAMWDGFEKSASTDMLLTLSPDDSLHKQAQSLIATFKTPEARKYAADRMTAADGEQKKVNSNAFRLAAMSRQIYVPKPDGTFERRPLTEHQLTKMLMDGVGVLYSPLELNELKETIYAGRTIQTVQDRMFNHIESRLGKDFVARSFQNDVADFVAYDKDVDGFVLLDDDKTNPRPDIGATYTLTGTRTDEKGRTKRYKQKVELSQELMRDVIQAVYEYEMAPDAAKDGKPKKSMEEVIDAILFPENGNAASKLQTLDIEDRARAFSLEAGAMNYRFRNSLMGSFAE